MNTLENYTNIFNNTEIILQEFNLKDVKNKLINSYEKNIIVIQKVLKDYGIDTHKIKKEAVKLSQQIKIDVKNRKDPKLVANTIALAAKSIITSTANDIKKLNLSSKIVASLLILISVIFVNTFLGVIAAIIFGSFGRILLIAILGPIVEEFAKRLAILQKYPFIYTGIFAGFEFLQYVIGLMLGGSGNLTKIIFLRVLTLGMHFATTIIQKYFTDQKEERDKLPEYVSYKGYFIALGVHSLWNILALIFNENLTDFIEV